MYTYFKSRARMIMKKFCLSSTVNRYWRARSPRARGGASCLRFERGLHTVGGQPWDFIRGTEVTSPPRLRIVTLAFGVGVGERGPAQERPARCLRTPRPQTSEALPPGGPERIRGVARHEVSRDHGQPERHLQVDEADVNFPLDLDELAHAGREIRDTLPRRFPRKKYFLSP